MSMRVDLLQESYAQLYGLLGEDLTEKVCSGKCNVGLVGAKISARPEVTRGRRLFGFHRRGAMERKNAAATEW